MRCIYCKSKDLELDESSGMYFCPKCHRLLSEHEVDPDVKKSDLALDNELQEQLYEEEEGNWTEAEPIEESNLGIPTLLMLGFLGGLPVFDFLTTIMVEWSNVRDEYKRIITCRFIARILTIIIVGALMLLGYKMYDIEYRFDIHNKMSTVVETVHGIMNRDGIQPELVSKSLEQIERTKTYQPEEPEVVPFVLKMDWSYMDGAVISGKTFLQLLEDTKEGNLSYLVQTRSIVEKFNEKTYRNVGTIVEEATQEGANDNYYYTGVLTRDFTPMQDDYNVYIENSIDDLYNKKFVFYVKESSDFRLDILRSESGTIIGFAITEVAKGED